MGGADPNLFKLAELGVPPALSRLACDEARKVAVRVFLLDNSGSTEAHDGHILRPNLLTDTDGGTAHSGRDIGAGYSFVSATRWQEICASAEAGRALGAATGVPCEFHLLNPLSGWRDGARTGVGQEGCDWLRTSGAEDDRSRLAAFLSQVAPAGVTPLAERVRALEARFAQLDGAAQGGGSGRIGFLVIVTDGAPTPLHSGQPTEQAARAALSELRHLTQRYPVRLVVRLTTDESSACDFWNHADAEAELPLDVLDDITAEAHEIAAAGNGWLAYTPALHMLRESGTLVGVLDDLDERRLLPGEAALLASLLVGGSEDGAPWPDWRHAASEFRAHLRARCAAAGSGYDARRLRPSPLVDAAQLCHAMRLAGWRDGQRLRLAGLCCARPRRGAEP